MILDAYMLGLRYIFVFYTVCSAVSLFLTFWVGNTSLKASKEVNDEETGSRDEIADRVSLQRVLSTDCANVTGEDASEKVSDDKKGSIQQG